MSAFIRKQTEFDSIDLTDDNVVDLTADDKAVPTAPNTSTANNTSINIYDVLSKRKRGSDKRSKVNSKTNATNKTKNNTGIDNKEAHDITCSSREPGPSGKSSNNGPVGADNSVNDITSQEHSDSMDTSDSQRPVLTRFRHFTRRDAHGFMSARVKCTSSMVKLFSVSS